MRVHNTIRKQYAKSTMRNQYLHRVDIRTNQPSPELRPFESRIPETIAIYRGTMYKEKKKVRSLSTQRNVFKQVNQISRIEN